MKKRRAVFCLVMVVVFLVAAMTGCEFEKTDSEKVEDLEYTVCDEGRLPEALVELIYEKRKEPFKLTYRTRDYLYIVIGYGAQDRTDLAVVLSELYRTENAIFVDADLVAKDTRVLENGKVSYPYIAVKCENYDLQVNFR